MPQIASAPTSPRFTVLSSFPNTVQQTIWIMPDDALLGDDIRQGDILKFVKQDAPLNEQDIYLIKIGEDYIAGRLKRLGVMTIIKPSNPEYESDLVLHETLTIIGTRLSGFLRLIK